MKLKRLTVITFFVMCIATTLAQAQSPDGSDIVPFVKSHIVPLLDREFGALYQDCSKVQSEKVRVDQLVQGFSSEQSRNNWCVQLINQSYRNPAFQSIFYGDCNKIVYAAVKDKIQEMRSRVDACEQRKIQEEMTKRKEQEEQQRKERILAQEKAKAEQAERMKNPAYRERMMRRQQCFDECQANLESCVIQYRSAANKVCGMPTAACTSRCDSI